MKTIGIIGGMSWESSAVYYRLINEEVKNRLGAAHSAELVMYSMDFQVAAQLEINEQWDELAGLLVQAITRIERAGADFVLMASNTVHKVAATVQHSINIPLLHIAAVTAAEVKKAGMSKVGLLGTRFVMEEDFYKESFCTHGIDVLVPDEEGKNSVHNIIYSELCLGNIVPQSKDVVCRMILNLRRSGAEAVVLGCTELPLLITVEDTPVRLFDTLALHVSKAVDLALEG